MKNIPTAMPLCLSMMLSCTLMACGWGYAAEQVGERRPDAPIQIAADTPAPTPASQKPPPPLKAAVHVPDGSCPVMAFTLFRLDDTGRQIKEIQCTTGKIMSLSRKNLNPEEVRSYRGMNLPLDRWYILVDAKHQKQLNEQTLTNQQLMGLSSRYKFKYHQRMPDDGFIIYVLEEAPLP